MDTTETPQKIPTKVRFIHKKPENYQYYSVNGVMGGVTSRGDFEVDFFFEHMDIPEEQIINYDEEGKPKPTDEEIPTDVIVIRDFKVGIIMSPKQAEDVGNWLINTISNYRKQMEKMTNKK